MSDFLLRVINHGVILVLCTFMCMFSCTLYEENCMIRRRRFFYRSAWERVWSIYTEARMLSSLYVRFLNRSHIVPSGLSRLVEGQSKIHEYFSTVALIVEGAGGKIPNIFLNEKGRV